MLGMEARVWRMLGMCCSTELHEADIYGHYSLNSHYSKMVLLLLLSLFFNQFQESVRKQAA